MTIKSIALSFLLAIIFLSISCICAKKQKLDTCGPFTTQEWKQCYDTCQSSMPLNLQASGFSESEILEMEIPQKCVLFCRESLYMKRIDAGCESKISE